MRWTCDAIRSRSVPQRESRLCDDCIRRILKCQRSTFTEKDIRESALEAGLVRKTGPERVFRMVLLWYARWKVAAGDTSTNQARYPYPRSSIMLSRSLRDSEGGRRSQPAVKLGRLIGADARAVEFVAGGQEIAQSARQVTLSRCSMSSTVTRHGPARRAKKGLSDWRAAASVRKYPWPILQNLTKTPVKPRVRRCGRATGAPTRLLGVRGWGLAMERRPVAGDRRAC